MTSFVARNDNYIAGVDVILSRIGGGTNFRDPTSALFGDHANLTLTQAIVTAFGGLRIPVGPPNLQLYGTVGARYFYSRTALDLSFPVSGFPPSGFAITKNWADPVAGLAAHYAINDKYFINFLADMGGLSNSATGQVLGSVGYNWTPAFSTTLGYRVLYTYFRDDNGPLRDYRYQSWMYGPFRRGQIRLLIRGVPRSAHQLSNARVTRFINAARLDEALKSMLYRARYWNRPFGSISARILSRTKRCGGSFFAATPTRSSP